MQLWDIQGKRLETLQRNAAWFVEGEANPYTRFDEVKPASRLQDFFYEGSHLWVLVRVADRNWKAARSVSAADLRKERGIVPIREYDEFLDSVIEVIDVRNGKLVASTRLDRYYHSFTNGGLLWTFRENDDGVLLIDVFRMALYHR